MPRDPIPHVHSGLPRPLERRLMRKYGRTTAGRMKMAAALRALAVLIGRHPRAALDMAGAGLVQAGRVGVQDLTRRLSRFDRRAEAPEAEPRPTLTRRELRRFRKMLDADAQRRRRDVDATS